MRDQIGSFNFVFQISAFLELCIFLLNRSIFFAFSADKKISNHRIHFRK